MGSRWVPVRAHIRRLVSIWFAVLILTCPFGGSGQEAAPDGAARRADDWTTVNKDYSSQRYVDLGQITPSNVGRLKEICEIDLDEPSWFSSGILKVGRTLYVAARRVTYAIDGATCDLLWRNVIDESTTATSNNRGLAYLNGKLFRGTADGRLIALDAATGSMMWAVQNADPTQNESFVAAPVAWDGKVFTGIATGDSGVRGRIMGFDANTGQELWRFYTVPASGPYRGGAFWTSFSLDPATREVFAPVSNPHPDFTGDVRPGANLYTNALLSLNTATGGINWYYQAVPHDVHDWDLGTAPALYHTSDGNGMLAIAGKDGHVYGIDRTSKQLVFKTAATALTNGDQPFPTNSAYPPTSAVRVCPGGIGGAQFTSTAYNPQLGALYVGMNDWCWFFFSLPEPSDPSQMEGVAQPDYSLGTPPRGWITAMDGRTGRVRWQYHADAQVQAGTVPTRSGVLFAGDVLGNLLALDARTGSLLKSIDAKGALNSGLISYAIDGVQYVAAAVGGLSFNSAGINRPLRRSAALRVKIFGLNAGEMPRIVQLDRVPLPGATPEVAGAGLYVAVCFSCHGDPSASGASAPVGPFPPLPRQSHLLTDPVLLKDFLATAPPPMPMLYPGLLNDDDIQLLVSLFKALNLPALPGWVPPTSGGSAQWAAIYSVLTHPRCINCHPATSTTPVNDYPHQADDRHPHLYGVVRGNTDGLGSAIASCPSCHGFSNNAFTSAPGAGTPQAPWRLAPASMAWESSPNVALTGHDLCTVLKDPSKNGGRSLADLLSHVTTEPLVLWAWHPGAGLNSEPRATPPISHDDFVVKFKAWVNAGGPCPAL